MLLVILLLLTKPEKRRAPVFIINVLSLGLNFIRSLLQCLYFTGGLNVPYAYFARDFSRVPRSDYANSVAATIFTLLVLVCIEASLVLQANIVCTTLPKLYRHGVKAVSAVVVLLAIGFRFALAVANIKATLATSEGSSSASYQWLASATNIATTVSICLFCAIFVVKLGAVMRERKKMGMRQFGPMRIIFIMGCQTMIIPGERHSGCFHGFLTVLTAPSAVFAILQYFTTAPELGSNVLTLVAIFLPLSSMWASTSVNGTSQSNTGPESQRKMVGSHSGSAVREDSC